MRSPKLTAPEATLFETQWYQRRPETAAGRQYAAESAVLDAAREETAQGHAVIERKTFMQRLSIEKGSAGEQNVDRALKRCVERDRTLQRVPEGGYSLTEPTGAQGVGDGVSEAA